MVSVKCTDFMSRPRPIACRALQCATAALPQRRYYSLDREGSLFSHYTPPISNMSSWLNKAAFTVPGNNIGRWGNAAVGNIEGPGTHRSRSRSEVGAFTETMAFQVGAQAANLFNHPNYAPPNTTFNTAAFGTISNLQTAEGAGPRPFRPQRASRFNVR